MKSRTLEQRLNDHEAAQFCGVSVATLRRHRWLKTGPSYIKLNSRVVYDEADLRAWLDRHRVRIGMEAA